MLTRSAHGSNVSPERCSQTVRMSSAMPGLYWNRLSRRCAGSMERWAMQAHCESTSPLSRSRTHRTLPGLKSRLTSARRLPSAQGHGTARWLAPTCQFGRSFVASSGGASHREVDGDIEGLNVERPLSTDGLPDATVVEVIDAGPKSVCDEHQKDGGRWDQRARRLGSAEIGVTDTDGHDDRVGGASWSFHKSVARRASRSDDIQGSDTMQPCREDLGPDHDKAGRVCGRSHGESGRLRQLIEHHG